MLTRKDQLELKKRPSPEDSQCQEELNELAAQEKPKRKRGNAKAKAKAKVLSPKVKLSPLARSTKLKMQDTRYYEPRGRGRGCHASQGSDLMEVSSPEVEHDDPVRRELFHAEDDNQAMASSVLNPPHHILDELAEKVKAKEAKAKPRAKAKATASAASDAPPRKRARTPAAKPKAKAQAKVKAAAKSQARRASSRPRRVDDAATQDRLRDDGILQDFLEKLKSEAAHPSVQLEELKLLVATDLQWFPRARVMPYWTRPAAAVKWVGGDEVKQIAYFAESGQSEKGRQLNRRLVVQIYAARLFVALPFSVYMFLCF